MASSYEDLKAAFLALQRVAVSARAGWLDRLGADDPGLHRDLMSFLAFEVDDVAVLDPDDRTGPEPLVGTRYADRGLLGVGGIGEVRRVFDPSLERTVALKFLRTRHVLDPDPDRRAAAHARFVTEARIQASLHHAAIPPVHERGELPDGRPYLTMAEVTGETLRARLPSWPLERAIEAFEAVCRAVAHAHERGVLHRDLKPSNVMIGEEDSVWVVDWGLALPRDRGQADAIAGTPAYMAPEQVRPDAPLDERTDVYALGAILYAILSGDDPYAGVEPHQIIERLRSASPPAAPSGPSALVALCTQAMDPEPDRRPSSASALADGARAWLDRADAPSRRWLGWGIGIGALVVVGIAAAAGWTWSLQDLARDREAAARLEALRTAVADHRAAGDEAAVDEAFAAFVALRDNLGTPALADAWLERAEVLQDRGDATGARHALALAYAEARTDDQRAEALLELMRSQARTGRWDAVSATLDALSRQAPNALLDPRAREATWRLAVAGRMFDIRGAPPDGSTRTLEPVVRAWGQARSLDAPDGVGDARVIGFDSDGDGYDELWSLTAEGLVAWGLPASGPANGTLLAWPGDLRAVAGSSLRVDEEPHLLVPDEDAMVLLAPGPSGLQVRGRWPAENAAGRPFNAAAGDLDGDGADEVLVGLPVERQLVRARRDGAGRWVTERPEGSTNRANSEVRGLVVEDLDADGVVDLAAGLGPWGAYDVRLLHETETGALALRSRYKVGPVQTLRRARGAEGVELVALVHDGPPLPRDFPVDPALGPRPGVMRFRVRDGALVDPRHTSLPLDKRTGFFVVDVDGDGIDEVVVSTLTDLWVGRLDRDDALVGLTLTDLDGLLALDADEDGRDELIVRDRADGRLWVLGSGQERLAARPPQPRPQLEPLPPGWLADQAVRTDALYAMGFAAEAADTLAGLASLDGSPQARGAALSRAARYLELEGTDPAAALALYERAIAEDPDAVDAHLGAARIAERLHRFGIAATHLETLQPGRSAALAALADAPVWTLRGDAAWEELASSLDPLGIRTDARRDRIGLETTGGEVLLRVPLTRTGDRLGIEIDGELTDLAWSSGISISLLPAGGQHGVRIWIHGHGGGGHVETAVGGVCGPPDMRNNLGVAQDHAPVLGPVRARIDCVPGRSAAFEIDGLGLRKQLAQDQVPDALPAGDWELVIAGRRTAEDVPLRAHLDLETIRVVGAAPRGVDPEWTAASAALVRGDPRAALALHDDDDPELTRFVALMDLGREGEVVAALPEPLRPDAWLLRAIRLRPGLAGALVTQRGSAAAPVLWRAWRGELQVRPDSADLAQALTVGSLAQVPLDGLSPELRSQILLARGQAWRRAGQRARAREALFAATADAPADLLPELAVARARLALDEGERASVLEHLQAALAASPAPEVLRDRLLADPELGGALVGAPDPEEPTAHPD